MVKLGSKTGASLEENEVLDDDVDHEDGDDIPGPWGEKASVNPKAFPNPHPSQQESAAPRWQMSRSH